MVMVIVMMAINDKDVNDDNGNNVVVKISLIPIVIEITVIIKLLVLLAERY